MSERKREERCERFLTTQQVADLLRCCTETVRTWSRRGLLPRPLAVGRQKRLWDAEQIRQALQDLRDRSARGGAGPARTEPRPLDREPGAADNASGHFNPHAGETHACSQAPALDVRLPLGPSR